MAGARVGRGLHSFDNFLSGAADGFECGRAVYVSKGCKMVVARHGAKTGRLKVGDHVYLNHYVIIDCHDSITIGNSVLIGPFSYVCDYDHPTTLGAPIGSQNQWPTSPVVIGNDVWIGAGVIILKGVTVGDGAVLGAGSIVTHNVEPNCVVAGNPARLLRMR